MKNIKTVAEAVEIFKKIPPERMNGIPGISIRVADREPGRLCRNGYRDRK